MLLACEEVPSKQGLRKRLEAGGAGGCGSPAAPRGRRYLRGRRLPAPQLLPEEVLVAEAVLQRRRHRAHGQARPGPAPLAPPAQRILPAPQRRSPWQERGASHWPSAGTRPASPRPCRGCRGRSGERSSPPCNPAARPLAHAPEEQPPTSPGSS